jgi:hypothetical protein
MDINFVTFQNGDSFYEELSKKYRRHKKGAFILAPSGAGKTHFCKAQTEPHWIDGDDLWLDAGAHPHPSTKWWTKGIEVINHVDQRSDVVTKEARLQGFWVIGASCFWLRPDAIVIPDWDTHVEYIKHRQENDYDGGATLDALEQVKTHIEVIKKWHTDFDVPLFKSVEAAAESFSVAENL